MKKDREMKTARFQVGDRVRALGGRPVPIAALLFAGGTSLACGTVCEVIERHRSAQAMVRVLWDGMRTDWMHWEFELVAAEAPAMEAA